LYHTSETPCREGAWKRRLQLHSSRG